MGCMCHCVCHQGEERNIQERQDEWQQPHDMYVCGAVFMAEFSLEINLILSKDRKILTTLILVT